MFPIDIVSIIDYRMEEMRKGEAKWNYLWNSLRARGDKEI